VFSKAFRKQLKLPEFQEVYQMLLPVHIAKLELSLAEGKNVVMCLIFGYCLGGLNLINLN
jgi:hypothetical protein